MAKRYWTIGGNYGFAGTDWEEEVDALGHMNCSEEELAAMTDDEVESVLVDDARERTMEKVDWYAKPSDEEEQDD